MNQRVAVILLLALVISGGATFVVYRALRARNAAAGPPAVQVVLATRKLDVGSLLKSSDLQMGKWPGKPPEGMATKKEGLIGRGVIEPIYAGEPLIESRLAAVGAGGGLAITIPPGMRAVGVKVNEIVGVAGFVVPGMRVDVLITGVPPGKTGSSQQDPEVRTVLQNIEVLSAGPNYQKDSDGKPITTTVVNLLVTPGQAEILTLSSNETKIQLVLRNPLDTQAAKPPGTAKSALFGAAVSEEQAPPSRPRRPRPAAKTPPSVPVQVVSVPPYRIEVFNGEKKTEAQFVRAAEEKK